MQYRTLLLAGALATLGSWSTALFADASEWYLGGQFTYSEPDSDRDTDEGLGGTLKLGKQFSDYIDLELTGTTLTFQRDVAPGLDNEEFQYNVGLDALFVINRGGFSPHFAIGGGGIYNDTRFNDEFGGYANAGLGFRFPLIENGLRFRFDARYLFDFTQDVVPGEDVLGDVRISAGFEVPLGGRGSNDSDGDGVSDGSDKCPNTPAGTQVGADGCPLDSDGDGVPDATDQCPNTPAGVPVGPNGCALDSDNDGVPDSLDQCPNTQRGTQVDSDGCPIIVEPVIVDADGDGVPDAKDQCPNTPPGVAVLTNGCAVGQSSILQGVNFEFDKAVLTSTARQILGRVAQTLNDSPGFTLEIAGHTDSLGSDSYNRDLSQQRADSVKFYLVGQGVEPNRLITRGYGESQPIADNSTETGQATNRRVELKVLSQQRR